MWGGRILYGSASTALGVVGLIWGAFAFAWQPVEPDLPGYRILAYAAGALLVLGGAGAIIDRTARFAAFALMVVYAGFATPWLIRVVRYPQLFGTWGGLAEQASLVLAAILVLRGGSAAPLRGGSSVETVCIRAYGVCAIVFGFNHFFSLAQTAGMVPGWLPPNQMFWAAATGVFHCVAGVAILANVQALIAARMLGCMMLVFEALVWLPYLIHSPKAHMVWAGNGTDIVLAGAAFVVADAITPRGPSAARSGAAPGPAQAA